MEFVRRNIKDLDIWIIVVLVGIAVFSCLGIYTSTFGKANPATGNPALGIPAHIMVRQIAYEILGFAAMFAMIFVDYRSLVRWRWWFYGITILMLVIVLKLHGGSAEVNGAKSWLPLPGFSFEPSEVAKVVLIVWAAAYMSRMNQREVPDYTFKGLWPIYLAFLVPIVLILKEPALGQAIVIAIIMISMLLVYVKGRHAALMLAAIASFVALVVLAADVFPAQSIHFLLHQHILHTYQTRRLITFIDPSYQGGSYSYQVNEAQIAVGNGGVFGTGLLKGSQTTGAWIPFQWTDFIFSAIAEQLGFLGSSILILLYLILFYRMVRIAMTAVDDFGAYIIAGAVGMFAFQVFENIGMNLTITPAAGFTLPFMSYGGSSLLVNFLTVGLCLSVSIRRRSLRFD